MSDILVYCKNCSNSGSCVNDQCYIPVLLAILENNILSIKELKKEIERLLYENEKLNKVNGCICANSRNSETLGYNGPADEPMSSPYGECPGSAPSSQLI